MAKSLLFVALLASVATADSNVVRSFHASIASNGTRTRYLRSNAAMVSMNYDEERALSSLPLIDEAVESMSNTLGRRTYFVDAVEKARKKRQTINDDNDASGTASRLSHRQISDWIGQGKTAEEVFKLLNLHEANGDLFDNPAFEVWVDFIETSYGYISKWEAMFSVLSHHYDIDALDKLLLARLHKNDSSRFSRNIARYLLEVRLDPHGDVPKSAEDVFTFLNLRDVKENLFDSSAFSLWVDYVWSLYLLHRVKMFDSMYSVLSHHYNDDDALDKLLISRLFINDESRFGGKFASGLLHGQLSTWAKNGKTAEKVFADLNLQKAKDKLFESPALPLWVDFVEVSLRNAREEPYPWMYSFLSDYYSDNDALMKMIDAQVEIKDDSYASRIASGLQQVHRLKED